MHLDNFFKKKSNFVLKLPGTPRAKMRSEPMGSSPLTGGL